MIVISAGLALSACKSNTAKTGNAVADSGSAGSSGAGDTTQFIRGSSSLGTSTSGNPADSRSDTTTIKH